jgi:hypothetical protein
LNRHGSFVQTLGERFRKQIKSLRIRNQTRNQNQNQNQRKKDEKKTFMVSQKALGSIWLITLPSKHHDSLSLGLESS